ncbi:MAG: methylenetetrahydrofolate reductase [NAD(P)H] [Candidatus Heimdallarchaeota archaeon]|nr:MAG: methylenetetrahydrofolate reductase [NAD(P)H] [Candidatus Heimdallarchaeota archaeon]
MPVQKIIDIFGQKEVTLSFEFFPPKENSQLTSFYQVVEDLVRLNPDFISVTYGAGGSTREKTMEVSTELQNRFNIPTVHHITCVGHSKQELIDILDLMKVNEIVNVLALRGDPPRGVKKWEPEPNGFEYAYQLCDLISKSYGDSFSCGVAGFPEGHPEALDKDTDAKYLKNKIDHGGEFIITQLFYDNKDYFEYVSRLRNIGVKNRIIPGILPVFNFKNLKNFCAFCGASIPRRLHDIFGPLENDLEATVERGVELATEQCRELLEGGAPGLHFYTLNKLNPIKEIVHNLEDYLL